MDRRSTAGALLALAACLACSAAAPTANNESALDTYEGAATEGCYYNFQHYGEGDRIMTNEPCLNCTCHNRMLMCYLRVCPFTKPIGQDCTIEKRADQCCPIITCPDVPVDLLTSTSTTSPAEYGITGVGHLDKYGCSIHGKYYPEGSKVPATPNKPCEHCYCIRNMTTCVMQECTLHVDGCTPIYHKDVCCPVRYSCDHSEDMPLLLDHMTTTVGTTPGFQWTTTMAPTETQDCIHGDETFQDGALIKTEKACEHCYCMKGDIVCVVQECGTPMENEGKNCTSLAPREGQCCPDTYICEGDNEITTDVTNIPHPTRTNESDNEMSTNTVTTLAFTKIPGFRIDDKSSNKPVTEAITDMIDTKESPHTITAVIDDKYETASSTIIPEHQEQFTPMVDEKDNKYTTVSEKEPITSSIVDEISKESTPETNIGRETTLSPYESLEHSTIQIISDSKDAVSETTAFPEKTIEQATSMSEEKDISHESTPMTVKPDEQEIRPVTSDDQDTDQLSTIKPETQSIEQTAYPIITDNKDIDYKTTIISGELDFEQTTPSIILDEKEIGEKATSEPDREQQSSIPIIDDENDIDIKLTTIPEQVEETTSHLMKEDAIETTYTPDNHKPVEEVTASVIREDDKQKPLEETTLLFISDNEDETTLSPDIKESTIEIGDTQISSEQSSVSSILETSYPDKDETTSYPDKKISTHGVDQEESDETIVQPHQEEHIEETTDNQKPSEQATASSIGQEKDITDVTTKYPDREIPSEENKDKEIHSNLTPEVYKPTEEVTASILTDDDTIVTTEASINVITIDDNDLTTLYTDKKEPTLDKSTKTSIDVDKIDTTTISIETTDKYELNELTTLSSLIHDKDISLDTQTPSEQSTVSIMANEKDFSAQTTKYQDQEKPSDDTTNKQTPSEPTTISSIVEENNMIEHPNKDESSQVTIDYEVPSELSTVSNEVRDKDVIVTTSYGDKMESGVDSTYKPELNKDITTPSLSADSSDNTSSYPENEKPTEETETQVPYEQSTIFSTTYDKEVSDNTILHPDKGVSIEETDKQETNEQTIATSTVTRDETTAYPSRKEPSAETIDIQEASKQTTTPILIHDISEETISSTEGTKQTMTSTALSDMDSDSEGNTDKQEPTELTTGPSLIDDKDDTEQTLLNKKPAVESTYHSTSDDELIDSTFTSPKGEHEAEFTTIASSSEKETVAQFTTKTDELLPTIEDDEKIFEKSTTLPKEYDESELHFTTPIFTDIGAETTSVPVDISIAHEHDSHSTSDEKEIFQDSTTVPGKEKPYEHSTIPIINEDNEIIVETSKPEKPIYSETTPIPAFSENKEDGSKTTNIPENEITDIIDSHIVDKEYVTTPAIAITDEETKATEEPDKGLNTVPIGSPELTITESPYTEKTSQYMTDDMEHIDRITTHVEGTTDKQEHTTEVITSSTQSAIDYHSPETTKDTSESSAISTEKSVTDEDISATSITEPTEKHILIEEISTHIAESTTPLPTYTKLETEIQTLESDKLEKPDVDQTENEIGEVFIPPITSPGVIPGEGSCLVDGITYDNNSMVPSSDKCQMACRCFSSIVKCDPIHCSPPPENMMNCQPIYDSIDSCCPTYICDHTKVTLPPQPHSQMSVTETLPEKDDCGDNCKKTDTVDEKTTTCNGTLCEVTEDHIIPVHKPELCTSESCSVTQDTITDKTTPADNINIDTESMTISPSGASKEDDIKCNDGNCLSTIPSDQICNQESGCKVVSDDSVSETSCLGNSCTEKSHTESNISLPTQECTTADCVTHTTPIEKDITKESDCKEENGCKQPATSDKKDTLCANGVCADDIDDKLQTECVGPECKDKHLLTTEITPVTTPSLDGEPDTTTGKILETEIPNITTGLPIQDEELVQQTSTDASEISQEVTTESKKVIEDIQTDISDLHTLAPTDDSTTETHEHDEGLKVTLEEISVSPETKTTTAISLQSKATELPVMTEVTETSTTLEEKDMSTQLPHLITTSKTLESSSEIQPVDSESLTTGKPTIQTIHTEEKSTTLTPEISEKDESTTQFDKSKSTMLYTTTKDYELSPESTPNFFEKDTTIHPIHETSTIIRFGSQDEKDSSTTTRPLTTAISHGETEIMTNLPPRTSDEEISKTTMSQESDEFTSKLDEVISTTVPSEIIKESVTEESIYDSTTRDDKTTPNINIESSLHDQSPVSTDELSVNTEKMIESEADQGTVSTISVHDTDHTTSKPTIVEEYTVIPESDIMKETSADEIFTSKPTTENETKMSSHETTEQDLHALTERPDQTSEQSMSTNIPQYPSSIIVTTDEFSEGTSTLLPPVSVEQDKKHSDDTEPEKSTSTETVPDEDNRIMTTSSEITHFESTEEPEHKYSTETQHYTDKEEIDISSMITEKIDSQTITIIDKAEEVAVEMSTTLPTIVFGEQTSSPVDTDTTHEDTKVTNINEFDVKTETPTEIIHTDNILAQKPDVSTTAEETIFTTSPLLDKQTDGGLYDITTETPKDKTSSEVTGDTINEIASTLQPQEPERITTENVEKYDLTTHDIITEKYETQKTTLQESHEGIKPIDQEDIPTTSSYQDKVSTIPEKNIQTTTSELLIDEHEPTTKDHEHITIKPEDHFTMQDQTTVLGSTVSELEKEQESVTHKQETYRPSDTTISSNIGDVTESPKITSSSHDELEEHVTTTPPKHDMPDRDSTEEIPTEQQPIETHKPSVTDKLPSPDEDIDHQTQEPFPPSSSGGYGQEPDYVEEDQAFGPGTCRYGGKVYVSAQQIPRDDPCDFCFCFRSDIICLQQSCPPPIHGCHEEPIQGFCCPRYECPVSMATTLNMTTTTTTTTTTLPPHFLPHAYKGAAQRRGCQIKGHSYQVGELVRASSGPCLHCTCGGDGQMKCDPKACTPEPMLRQMIAAAVSAKRRR